MEMTKAELIQRSMNDLKAFGQLPVGELWRRMVAWGVIDPDGKVLFDKQSFGRRQISTMPLAPTDAADYML